MSCVVSLVTKFVVYNTKLKTNRDTIPRRKRASALKRRKEKMSESRSNYESNPMLVELSKVVGENLALFPGITQTNSDHLIESLDIFYRAGVIDGKKEVLQLMQK